ncbi:MAG: sensor histidine kinase [Acidimicrobiia bacterium]|nr:sensor histidine kinase [Acidimicrobiia bacterium]
MFGWVIVGSALAYIGLLFLIARYADRRAERGHSLIANPYVYSLSLAVYCTAWTFYGSVGRAASAGIGFLPIYLGPTLMAGLWWVVLRKIIRISKQNSITSIADFISSRYGKGLALGVIVTGIAAVGIVPYVALQLDGIATSFALLWHYPDVTSSAVGFTDLFGGTAFWVALLLGTFAILFGTRHLDVTEHHEGLVAAIAFESVVKLFAFLAVGVFVTWGLFSGPGDIFTRAAADTDISSLLRFEGGVEEYWDWGWLMVLSALAIMFLPRQFQMAVVENTDESHLNKAIWLFPLYLFVMNLFVLPIAVGGRLTFEAGSVDPDNLVLLLPMADGQRLLALVAFIGGLSAAASMVIVATVALSTMVSNDVVIPVLLRVRSFRLAERGDVSSLVLGTRRITILSVVLLGYFYFRLTEGALPLVSIGLISFAAIAQLAPSMLGGLYWKPGNRRGAIAGMVAGFTVWAYTLAIPTLVESGLMSDAFIESGPFGIEALRPFALLGLEGFDPITNGLFWSLLINAGLFMVVSILTDQTPIEQRQASIFVDVFKGASERTQASVWQGTASFVELRSILERVLGSQRADALLMRYAATRGIAESGDLEADADLVTFVEQRLAGAVGAVSARALVSSAVEEAVLSRDEVLDVLDETTRVLAYSRQLEQQQRELEQATEELQNANLQLLELDRMKDDFMSAVTHELRTPLTSIRAFTEILDDNPDLDHDQRSQFLDIILKESERLTRHINQVLDFAKIESGTLEWKIELQPLGPVVEESLQRVGELLRRRHIDMSIDLGPSDLQAEFDHDRLIQVIINLVSNAVKFSDPDEPRVWVTLQQVDGEARVTVADNGPGVPPEHHELIFEKFQQVADGDSGKPRGTGLGLPISKEIITQLGGRLWIETAPGPGAVFCFALPLAASPPADDPGGGEAVERTDTDR